MTRQKGGAAALAASKGHLAGGGVDNEPEPAGKAEQDQGDGAGKAVDNAGEEGRQPFVLSDEDRGLLTEARQLDEQARELKQPAEAEQNFWAGVGPVMAFIQTTVEPAEDVLESGSFTAWPIEPAEKPEPEFDSSTNEADHSAGVDRIERLGELADLAVATAGGDLRDMMLDVYRNRHKPWAACSPQEQKDIATAIDYAVKVALRRAVLVIASDGRASITASLEKYADKGGEITATIKIVAAQDDTVLALHRASGKQVLIVAADAGDYLGERRAVQIDRDDPELHFDAGKDQAPPPAAAAEEEAEREDEEEQEEEQEQDQDERQE